MEARTAVGPAELATLKLLAMEGALPGPATVTCAGLADRLDASTQTASRRLQRLEEADLLDRAIGADGQRVAVTDDGRRRLEGEYADYRRIFEDDASVALTGAVTSGMGEGRHYISLPGYMEQFRERLGYEPFAGTLNVDLDDESVRARAGMDALDPVTIEGWADDDRTYGPAYCWPATVEVSEAGGGAAGTRYQRAHAIAPERTHHGDDQLELIAPVKLRDELAIDDGDVLEVHVAEQ